MIDIDIGESYVDLIAAMVKNYTRNKKEYESVTYSRTNLI